MDIDNFELQDYDEEELAAKREAQLREDEEPEEASNECEGGGCVI